MQTAEDTEIACRRCHARCDTVVYLSGCVRNECPALYEVERDGRAAIGCLHGVFSVEIDHDAFERLQRTAAGFGALRAVRPPQPECTTDVDTAFEHRCASCVNPDFLLSGSRRRVQVRAAVPPDDCPPVP